MDPSHPLVLLSPSQDAWNHLALSLGHTLGVVLSNKDLVDGLLKNHTFR